VAPTLSHRKISDLLADILDKVCQGVWFPRGLCTLLSITVSNLSKHHLLGGLSPPHDAFQGHAAHPPSGSESLAPNPHQVPVYLRAISPFSFALSRRTMRSTSTSPTIIRSGIHQGLDNQLIAREEKVGCHTGHVVRRERLGGCSSYGDGHPRGAIARAITRDLPCPAAAARRVSRGDTAARWPCVHLWVIGYARWPRPSVARRTRRPGGIPFLG